MSREDIFKQLAEEAEEIQEAKNNVTPLFTSSSQYKSTKESIITDDFTQKLYEAGRYELNLLIQAWEESESKTRKPTKLPPGTVADILKKFTRFVTLATTGADDTPPVFMYLESEGIYTKNRAIINRYMRVVENKVTRHDQSEIYNKLIDTAESEEKTNDRHIIPVDNGVFNLNTKTLEPFSPDYVFTTKIATDYKDNPMHPTFKDGWNVDDWLLDIANGDDEISRLLWQVIADAINGNYSRKRSIWLVGDGSNGKGTYQDLIRHLVGTKNVAGLKIDQFAGNSNGQNFNLSMLEGKTVNIGDDVQSNLYIDDSSNFNSVVTGDPVIVEHKGKGGYVVEFTLTIIQSTNGLPKIKNKTNGTYRRLLFVPFNASFSGTEANYDIKEKYIKNKQVLEYVLHKAINLDFEDFTIPQASIDMLEDYKISNDPVREFVEESFKEIMEKYDLDRLPKRTAHDLFKQFCKDRNYQQVGYNNFIKQFEELILNDYESKSVRWLDETGILRYDIPAEAKHPEKGQILQGYVRL